MEREKSELILQRELQRKIIGSLLFEEPFNTLIEEIHEKEKVIADELRNMIDKGWVRVVEQDSESGAWKKTLFYDVDNMRSARYVATQKGLVHFKLR